MSPQGKSDSGTMTDRQIRTHNSSSLRAAYHVRLPVRRCVSVLPPECQSNNLVAVSRQAKGVDQPDDKHMRKRSRRRNIWVPPDDTTILAIYSGAHSDTWSLANSSTKAINQPDAERRRQRNPFAAASEQAPSQEARKPLQENENQACAYISV